MSIIKTTVENFVSQRRLYTPLFKESVKGRAGTLQILNKVFTIYK